MKISKLIFSAFAISLIMLGSANAQDVGDPDSEAAPDSAPVPPGWGNGSSISVQDNDDNPDDNPDAALQKQEQPAQLPIPNPALQNPAINKIEDPDATAQPDEADKWHEMKFARLQGLNKITAKTQEIKADLGAKLKFGNLDFTVEKCLRGPENERAENTVLLTVWDAIPGQERKQIFRGWMFSSSPAISALEHPIYDIILLGCGEAPKPVAPVEETKKPDSKKADNKKTEKTKAR